MDAVTPGSGTVRTASSGADGDEVARATGGRARRNAERGTVDGQVGAAAATGESPVAVSGQDRTPAAPIPATATVPPAPAAAAPRRPKRRGPAAAPAPVPEAAVGAGPVALDAPAGEEERPDVDVLALTRRVRNLVAGVSLNLQLPEVEAARRERELLLAHLDDYLLPRLRRMDAPLLAVIGGSTGAGKSTLTNSLARKEVSRSGVLRPTTRSPVLVHHPYDSGAFLTQRILPGLERITSEALEPAQPAQLDAPRITALRLVPHEGITAGLALLDAPDIDSVVEANRELAIQLLGAADLWLFVTTAARYGDAMPWEMLRTAAERGVSVAVVLDRVPRESMRVVRADLARLLRDQGLGSSPMFTIPELPLEDGLLPQQQVAPLLRWLYRLAADTRSREMVIRRTLFGALDALPPRLQAVAAGAVEQEAAAHLLRTELDALVAGARSQLARHLSDGTLLRGEVLARWQQLVAGGDLMRHVERSAGRLTDRIVATVRRPPPLHTEELGEAIVAAARAVVSAEVLAMSEQAVQRWEERPGGAGLVSEQAAAAAAGELEGRVARLVEEWRQAVAQDTSAQAGLRRLPPWGISLGSQGMSVLVALAALSQAAQQHAEQSGEPAGEALAATGVAQRLLEGLSGEDTIRPLLHRIHAHLLSLVDALCDAERARLQAVVDAAEVTPGAGEALRLASRALEQAR